jgi:hypothetical protein
MVECPDGEAKIKWRPGMFVIIAASSTVAESMLVVLPEGNTLTLPASREFPALTAPAWALAMAAFEIRVLACPPKAWVDANGDVTIQLDNPDLGNPTQVGAFFQE